MFLFAFGVKAGLPVLPGSWPPGPAFLISLQLCAWPRQAKTGTIPEPLTLWFVQSGAPLPGDLSETLPSTPP